MRPVLCFSLYFLLVGLSTKAVLAHGCLVDPQHQVGLGDKGDENASEDSLWGDASALASAIGVGSHHNHGARHLALQLHGLVILLSNFHGYLLLESISRPRRCSLSALVFFLLNSWAIRSCVRDPTPVCRRYRRGGIRNISPGVCSLVPSVPSIPSFPENDLIVHTPCCRCCSLFYLLLLQYGVYSTILTLKTPSDDEVSMSLVLGYMGLANLLIFL